MEAGKVQGSSDSPLSTAGKREAELTAQALLPVKFDAVFCSPLGRTQETAGIICAPKKNEIKIIEDLREIDFGWFEGKTNFDPPTKDSSLLERLNLLTRVMLSQLSGESFNHVKKRAHLCLQEINQSSPQGTILIVAHGVILTQMLRIILNQEIVNPDKPVYLKPCNITEIVLGDEGEPEILRLNNTDHINKN